MPNNHTINFDTIHQFFFCFPKPPNSKISMQMSYRYSQWRWEAWESNLFSIMSLQSSLAGNTNSDQPNLLVCMYSNPQQPQTCKNTKTEQQKKMKTQELSKPCGPVTISMFLIIFLSKKKQHNTFKKILIQRKIKKTS